MSIFLSHSRMKKAWDSSSQAMSLEPNLKVKKVRGKVKSLKPFAFYFMSNPSTESVVPPFKIINYKPEDIQKSPRKFLHYACDTFGASVRGEEYSKKGNQAIADFESLLTIEDIHFTDEVQKVLYSLAVYIVGFVGSQNNPWQHIKDIFSRYTESLGVSKKNREEVEAVFDLLSSSGEGVPTNPMCRIFNYIAKCKLQPIVLRRQDR